MEEQVERLSKKVWDKYKQAPASKRILIGIAGIPGSGKTTLAALLTRRLNDLYQAAHPSLVAGTNSPLAAFVPMDGYHLTRAQLSAMPDPARAHARRGAAFTFDAEAFLALVRALAAPLTPERKTVYAPSFDHEVKDPVADDIKVGPEVRIVVLEGNYVALAEEPWSEARGLLDECWFVEVDAGVARRRLVERHVAAGIAKDEEEADRRVSENDLVNGEEINAKRSEVDEVVKSIEDEGWSAKGNS